MIDFIIQKAGGGTINLYNKNSATLSTVTSAEQTQGLNSDDIVRITVESAVKITFDIGDKMNILGRWYKINRLPTVKKTGNRLFTYNIELEGVQYDLARVVYDLTIDTTSNALQDVQADMLTGNLQRFATVLISNANRVFPGKWVLGDFPAGTEDKTLVFGETDNCLLVLQRLCSEYNTEFEIIQAGDVNTLHFRKAGQIYPYTFEYGKGKGLYSLERLNVSTSNIVTRLKVYGDTRNITAKYRAARLCLPGKTKGQSYIQKTGPANNYGIWEATKIFEHIYPKRTGTVTAIDSGNVLKLTDSTMNFDLNEKEVDGITTKYLIDGSPAKIHFNTGNLSGYEFEIQSYDHATKTFTLKPFEDERGERFPSEKSSAFKFAVNDKYVLLDIALPQSYIDDAEEQLAEEGDIYYDQNSQPKVQYSLEVAEEFLKELSGAGSITNIFSVGDYIPVKDADIDVDKSVRVQSFTRDLLNPFSYKLNISDTVTTSITNRVISELIEIDKITKINDIKSQVKARRDWRSAQELLDMVFDTEGDYYSEKIKPNSIETSMLAVGAKSTQFGLVGTVIQANYNGNKNSVNVKGGTLSHYAIEESGRNWTLADGTTTLTGDSTPYYIYAKCQKSGTAGSIIFSTQKITVEQDPLFYHFFVGVVNSVDIELGVRSVALTYGFTTINGRFIRTGRIQSNDGLTYFDLDLGEIGGKITFRSTGGTDEDLAEILDGVSSDIQDTQAAAGNAQAAANAAQSAVDDLDTYVDGAFKDGVIDAAEAKAIEKYKNTLNETMSKAEASYNKVFANTYLPEGTAKTALLNAKVNLWGQRDTLLSAINTAISGGTTTPAQKTAVDNAFNTFNNLMTAFQNALEEANKAIQVKLDNISKGYVNDLQIGGRNYLRNSSTTKHVEAGAPAAHFNWFGVNSLKGKIISFSMEVSNVVGFTQMHIGIYNLTNNYLSTEFIKCDIVDGKVKREGMPVPNTTDSFAVIVYAGLYGQTSGNSYDFKHEKAEIGNKVTDWSPAPEDVDAEINQVSTGLSNLDDEITKSFSNLSITNIEANSLDLSRKSLAKEVADVRAIGAAISVDIADIDTKMAALNTEVDKYTGKPDADYPITVTVANRLAIQTAFSNLEASIVALYEAIDKKRVADIKVGGVNLFEDYEHIKFSGHQGQTITYVNDGDYKDIMKIDNPSYFANIALKNRITPHETSNEYIVSILAKGVGKLRIFTSSGTFKPIVDTAMSETTYNRYDIIIPTLNGFHLNTSGASLAYVAKMQLMRGNKPMDWTSSPNDEIISSRNLWLGTGSPITRSGTNYSLVSRDLRGFISEGDTCTLQFDLTTTLAYDSRIYASKYPYISWGDMTEFYKQNVPAGKSKYKVTFNYKGIADRPYLIFYKNVLTQDTATFENLTLVKGTKAVWSEAPEDVQARIDAVDAKAQALEYLKQAIGQDAVVDGALYTLVTMLLKEDMNAQVTAGFTGIQGALKNLPAIWAGGTYQQALTNLAKAIIRHDGTVKFTDAEITGVINAIRGKIGSLDITETGDVVMFSDEESQDKLIFRKSKLPSIASLVSAVNSNGSTGVGAGIATLSTSQVVSGSTNVSNDGAIATFNGTTLTLSARGQAQAGGMASYAEAVLYARQNGVRRYKLATVRVWFTDTAYTDGSDSITPLTYNLPVDAGLYTFELVIETVGSVSNATATSSSSTFSWVHTVAGVKRQQYGLDGMMFFYSGGHFYFNETGFLDGKAPANKWNAPGVLAAGSSTSGGIQSNVWGAKSSPANITPITGGFRIPLSGLSHSNYVVQITPHTNTTFRVGTKTSTYFEVYGTGGFDYVVIGNNYA